LLEVNARNPDFKHKKTEEGLWLEDRCNPLWVGAQMSAMAPLTIQLDSFTWSRRLARCVEVRQY
jgi:hypothetical protein